MLTWRKESDYHLKAVNFTIAKAVVGGVPKYTLWLGPERIDTFETADQAKAAAEIRDRQELAGAA